jgi:hypothetical protein
MSDPVRSGHPGDSEAEEALKSVVIRTAEGDLVHAGEWANEEALQLGAPEPPDQTVIATGELYKPPA